MAIIRPLGNLSTVFLDGDDGQSDRASDYQNVPASDKGNSSYSDRGGRGTYVARSDPYPSPDGVKWFEGYGADAAALQQGYVTAKMDEDPAYDLINYKDRSTLPLRTNEDFGNTSALPRDYEFRGRNRTSRGFLKRPHLPTER